MTTKWRWILGMWLPLAVGVAAITAISYAMIQQDLRLSADDPQIQMSEDAAAAIAGGKAPSSLLPQDKVDAATSLAPFVIVLDETGTPTDASVQLDGQTPLPPPGVFDYARTNGQNRFTWQPAPGVRIATVVTHYAGGGRSGFVLAGRSLREVERRIDLVGKLALLGLVGSLGATLVVCGVVSFVRAD